ncbi:Cysteine protease [Phytophthora megakarya]|uniref:Cysteine protease n=1 Tax=Phytophthora megakarya TaxID=4795 RepID=A0A225WZ27_9STRA|nr:Cysteine protease [Phytophthora megakarya]
MFRHVFVTKALSAIRTFRKSLCDDKNDDDDGVSVRVPRFEIYSHTDIKAMDFLTKMSNTINWLLNTSTKRIGVPPDLEGGISDAPIEGEAMITRILLHQARRTPFGSVPYHELLWFCEDKRLIDGAMGHGIALLQRVHDGVGVVSPISHGFRERNDQITAIGKGNNVIQLPLNVDGNHWCGVVVDLRPKRWEILRRVQVLLNDFYKELYQLLHVKLETKSRQPDTSSCGVTVLMFFECKISGIALPITHAPPCMRFLRMRYLSKCMP